MEDNFFEMKDIFWLSSILMVLNNGLNKSDHPSEESKGVIVDSFGNIIVTGHTEDNLVNLT